MQKYVEAKLAPAVDKNEIEYKVEAENDDTKKLSVEGYKVIAQGIEGAKTVNNKFEITIKVLSEPTSKFGFNKVYQQNSSPNFLK